MKKGQKLWTRDELILAINLYCKLPFGRLHQNNPEVIRLAQLIGRTPGSVAFKLVNFASLDPSLKERGIKGASNASKLDKQVWDEFYSNWDTLLYESEKLLASFEHTTLENQYNLNEDDLPSDGEIRERVVKIRVNQWFFRKIVLSSYNNICCITGLDQPELLIAGHIKPWSVDEKNRLNPRNGIAMNALHDKAFENGLLTITPDYKIKISPLLYKQPRSASLEEYLLRFDNQEMILPDRFRPDVDFLKYHNEVRFKH